MDEKMEDSIDSGSNGYLNMLSLVELILINFGLFYNKDESTIKRPNEFNINDILNVVDNIENKYNNK